MSIKTISIIIITALLTIFLMVNNDAVEFDFLIGQPVQFSKLIVIGVCILIGFILGYIAGRPKNTTYNNAIDSTTNAVENQNNLSSEDKDYIN